MNFQFNLLPLVEEPNIQIPRGIALDENLNVPLSEARRYSSISWENKQRVVFNLPLPKMDRLSFIGKRSGSNTTESSNSKVMSNTYTIKGKRYKIPHQYFSSIVHFSTGICKENKGGEDDFHKTFVRDFLKYYEENYLKWNQIDFGNLYQIMTPVASSERSVEDCLQRHLYDVIACPIIHSLEAKKEEIVHSIDQFSSAKGAVINGAEIAKIPTEPIFKTGGLFSTNFMGIHCFPDLLIGAGAKQGPGAHELEAISCTIIGKTKTPDMRLRGVYHLLTQSNDSSDWDETNEVKDDAEIEGEDYRLNFDRETGIGISNGTKISDFQAIVSELVTAACHIGVNRIMLTTYTDTLLIHVDPEFVRLTENSFDGVAVSDENAPVYLKNRHFLIKSSDPMIRLKVASFFHVSDTSVNERKLFQENVVSYLKEIIPTVAAK